MLMAMFMKETGLMIKLVDMVLIFTLIMLNMKDNERMINKMEQVRKLGRMELDTMVNTYKARNTVKENSHGQTEALIMENLSKITFKEKESIIGPTVVSMMDSGKIIRWKATVYSHGLMVVVMKALM